MRILTLFTFFCVIGMLACSTTKETNTKTIVTDPNYISLEEIQNSSASNAYDLIRKARPHWLRGRGTKSLHREKASSPVVYVNDSQHGDLDSLWSISLKHITEIRFLNPGDATNKYGLDHASGAILITTF